MNYRTEIDGLRAIAIFSIILYHAGIIVFERDWFEGGFIGVDIFFVISGYLITRIILSELFKKGSFGFLEFYESRARRILPMLLIVMFVSFPFAWQRLVPSAFIEYSNSILSALVFSSNFFFYYANVYYGAYGDLLKPFLHTWSLSIEGQFYILFPIFLLLFYKFFRNHLLTLFLALLLLSLQLTEISFPRDPSLTFYFPYSRLWELLVGSVLAYLELKYGRVDNSLATQTLPIVGLYLITYSVLYFDANTPHPSFTTTLPIVGVALVIAFSSSKDLVGQVLGSRPFVGIGLISYSAYLWHFPLFSFSRIGNNFLSNYDKFGLITLTLVLSAFSYFLIEKPFRNRSRVSKKSFSIIIGLGVLILCGIQMLAIRSDGFDYGGLRTGLTGKTYLKQVNLILADEKEILRSNYTKREPDLMLLGDSHAEHLLFGLSQVLDGGILPIGGGGCIPLWNLDSYSKYVTKGACVKIMNNAIEKFISNVNLKTLVLSAMGPAYITGVPFKDGFKWRYAKQNIGLINDPSVTDRWKIFETAMRNTFSKLKDLNRNIIFVIDVPELGKNDLSSSDRLEHLKNPQKNIKEKCLMDTDITRYRKFGPTLGSSIDKINCRVPRSEFSTRVEGFHDLVKKVANDFPYVKIFDPTDIFCDENFCYGYQGNTLLYKDVDHLNAIGSRVLANELVKLIKPSD